MKKKQWFTFGSIVLILAMLVISAYAAHTHTWGAWKTEIAPTCLKEGRQVRSCTASNCGTHDRRPVAKIPHSYSAATCTKLSRCTSGCGQTIGSLKPHNYSAATCVKKAACSGCGQTTGSLGQHRFTTASCTKKATCTVCNTSVGSLAAHKYAPATCTSPRTCSVCRTTTGVKLGHNIVNGKCTRCPVAIAR